MFYINKGSDTMEFIFETNYDAKGILAMAAVLRKTIRKKRNRRTHIMGWLVILMAILLVVPAKGEEFVIESSDIITWIVVIIMILVLIFEDKINAYIARKRMLKGTEKSITTFKEENYTSETKIGKSEFHYDNIKEIAETNDYFVFIFDQSHAQIYDKKGITSGTIDEFRKFISEKTKKEVQKIK